MPDAGRSREGDRAYGDHLVDPERLAAIGRMAAEMAHQVRNPLSSISLNLELLEDQVQRLPRRQRAEAAKLIGAIQKEIDNLAMVTESYLRFVKLPPFHLERTDLNAVVRDVLVFAKPQIEQCKVRVSQRLEPGLPWLRLDRRQFKFAVLNLVTNALEAMSPGGRLRVRTRLNGGGVDLSISDTGEGIEKEDIPRIYDPFYTTKQGGTGLGLALVRRIVESHGGRVACESIRHVGTTFTISLPLDGAAPGEEEE